MYPPDAKQWHKTHRRYTLRQMWLPTVLASNIRHAVSVTHTCIKLLMYVRNKQISSWCKVSGASRAVASLRNNQASFGILRNNQASFTYITTKNISFQPFSLSSTCFPKLNMWNTRVSIILQIELIKPLTFVKTIHSFTSVYHWSTATKRRWSTWRRLDSNLRSFHRCQ